MYIHIYTHACIYTQIYIVSHMLDADYESKLQNMYIEFDNSHENMVD